MVYYLDHWMRLTKNHRVIGFAQNRSMEPYIFMNTETRVAAKIDKEKDFEKVTE